MIPACRESGTARREFLVQSFRLLLIDAIRFPMHSLTSLCYYCNRVTTSSPPRSARWGINSAHPWHRCSCEATAIGSYRFTFASQRSCWGRWNAAWPGLRSAPPPTPAVSLFGSSRNSRIPSVRDRSVHPDFFFTNLLGSVIVTSSCVSC
jgi:hypothetical protein